jgi:hypothetical protein
MYIFTNLNPKGLKIGDCVVRAISAALNQPWERTYVELCVEGFEFANLPNANEVWGSYLRRKGFTRFAIPNTCPDCYTFGDFVAEHTTGTYIVATGSHVACVKDGKLLDNWDSSNEVVAYYFSKG